METKWKALENLGGRLETWSPLSSLMPTPLPLGEEEEEEELNMLFSDSV